MNKIIIFFLENINVKNKARENAIPQFGFDLHHYLGLLMHLDSFLKWDSFIYSEFEITKQHFKSRCACLDSF